MILEIAQIDVKPGTEADFEGAVAKAAPLFKRAKGCIAMELQRSIEKPSRYRLFVQWETLEDHTVAFRGSPAFRNGAASWDRISRARPRWSTRSRPFTASDLGR